MDSKSIFRQFPDPRGMQCRDYRLSSILGLIVVSLLCGRRAMRAAFFLGRGLNKRQCRALGFSNGKTPCHATLTETLRVIDAGTLADILGAACPSRAATRVTSALTARACARARMVRVMRRTCCRRFAPVCNRFSAPKPHAAGAWRYPTR